MSRPKKRAKNPVLPRMAHIDKTFNDYVTMATFGAWAEATGQHGLRDHLARIFHAEGNVASRALRMVPGLSKEYGTPLATRFDRYLPWVAREIKRMFKPYKRSAKKHGLPEFPPGYDMLPRGFPASLSDPTSRFGFGHGLEDLDDEIGAIVWNELTELARDTRTLQDRFHAIVDWAEAESVDLNKYNWQEASVEAERWGAERQFDEVPQGEVVYTFPNGWTVQKLTTQAELQGEGDAMQHCVGEGSYCPATPTQKEVTQGGAPVHIYSLRDAKGLPHATLEWDPQEAYAHQLRGKQNEAPKPEYLRMMVTFRREYLDPESPVQPLPDFEPGLLDEFSDHYEGAWAGPGGTIHVVYSDSQSNRKLKSYDLGTLRQYVESAWDHAPAYAQLPPDATEEQEREILEEFVRDWVQTKTLRGGDLPGRPPLLEESDLSALEWERWKRGWGEAEHDEMVYWLVDEGIYPSRRTAANPARRGRAAQGGSSYESLKRRLMR